MAKTDHGGISRRAALGLIGGGAVLAAQPGFAAAPAVNLGKGAYRAVSLSSARLGERCSTVYWADGVYIPEAIEEISYLLRDWRQNAAMPYDPRTLDVVAGLTRRLGISGPVEVVSGYRSKATNDMLRRTNRGVAKNSYHTRAMAIDIRVPQRSVRQVARAAESLHGGGVGRYSRSNFVHVDSGPLRTWGR